MPVFRSGLIGYNACTRGEEEKAKTTRTAKPKMDQGSGETTKERERRLLRECRGRPNAGACEGFTRG